MAEIPFPGGVTGAWAHLTHALGFICIFYVILRIGLPWPKALFPGQRHNMLGMWSKTAQRSTVMLINNPAPVGSLLSASMHIKSLYAHSKPRELGQAGIIIPKDKDTQQEMTRHSGSSWKDQACCLLHK